RTRGANLANVAQATRIVDLATAQGGRQTCGLISFWPASVPRGDPQMPARLLDIGSGAAPPRRWLVGARDRQDAAHPIGSEVGVSQEPRPVHQEEPLGAVDDRARA